MKILVFLSFLLVFSLLIIGQNEANDVNDEKIIPKNGSMENKMNELNYDKRISI